MGDRLAGKVAVITGGASGIGRAAALRFLAEGARVIVGDLNAANAEDLLGEAVRKGYGAQSLRFRKIDVSREEDVEGLIAETIAAFGALDCMFNNAGVAGALAPICEMAADDWDRTFALLARSVFLGVKHGARAMQKSGAGGSIINTSSAAGLTAGAGPAAYSSAKAAVIGLTRSAALELARDRIRVNAIAPGGVQTAFGGAVRSESELRTVLERCQPWPDIGQPDDIANVALFLASDESRFLTGSTLLADGGMLASGPGLFPRPLASSADSFNMGSTSTR